MGDDRGSGMTAPAGSVLVPPGESADDQVAIVAARAAWPLYQRVAAYITHNERSFRPTRRMGFYADRTIYPALPLVVRRHDNVMIDAATAARLLLAVDPHEQRLGAAVKGALDFGWDSKLLAVILLTPIDDPRTIRRSELHHDGASAWTMGQRYARLGELLSARTTADLT